MQTFQVKLPDPSISKTFFDNVCEDICGSTYADEDVMKIDTICSMQSEHEGMAEKDPGTDTLATNDQDDSSFEEEEYCDLYLRD